MTALEEVAHNVAVVRTELGCRSFFRVTGDPHIETKVREQLHSWLTTKRWTNAELSVDGPTDIAPGVVGSLARLEDRDGSLTERYRFFQQENPDRRDQTWVTEVTVHVARGGDSWVWVDVAGPSDVDPAVPKVVHQILEVAEGLDGSHHLTPKPTRADVDDVDYIVSCIQDPKRRGPLYLAGSSETLGGTGTVLPLSAWLDYVTKVLRGTKGIASAYVLDPEATQSLNARLPESHRLTPWTLRTYLPRADLSDPQDGVRHRFLTTSRIVDSPVHFLRRIFTRNACIVSRTAPLPADVVRLDRRLRAQLDDAIVEQLTRTPPIDDSAVTDAPADTPPESATGTIVADLPPDEVERDRTGWMAALHSVVERVVGVTSITADAITRLGDLAARGRIQTTNTEKVQTRLRFLQDKVDDLEFRLYEAEEQRQDALVDLAVLQDYSDTSQRELRHLRGELARVDKGTVIWNAPDEAEDAPPNSFDDVFDLIDRLDYVKFTGDRGPTEALEQHAELDTWARITANAVRALNSYADRVTNDEFAGSVEEYLRNTPPGAIGFPPNKHAGNETPMVQNTTKFAKPRTFSVPAEVSNDSEVFMGAHFKIAAYGMISPRMHYYNDVSGTGKIYIGYIGQHLLSPLTN